MSYTNHPVEFVDRDWLYQAANRRPYFGTSHTATLFDDHPFQSAADYWLDKTQGRRDTTTPATIRGTYLEPSILAWFRDTNKLDVHAVVGGYRRGHLLAVPDAVIADDDILVSIKTTSIRRDEPEDYWIWQIQAEMLTCDARGAYIVWLDGGMELKQTYVEPNSDVFGDIWDRSAEFMRSTERSDMPDWVSRDTADLIRQFPNPQPEPLEAGSHGMDLVRDYVLMAREAKRYAEGKDEIKRQLFDLARDHEAISEDGNVIVTLKARKGSMRFDTAAFDRDHPGLREKYMVRNEGTRVVNVPKGVRNAIEDQA